jgi:hypothetical protein
MCHRCLQVERNKTGRAPIGPPEPPIKLAAAKRVALSLLELKIKDPTRYRAALTGANLGALEWALWLAFHNAGLGPQEKQGVEEVLGDVRKQLGPLSNIRLRNGKLTCRF